MCETETGRQHAVHPPLPPRQPMRSIPAMTRGVMMTLGIDTAPIYRSYATALEEATLLRFKLRESELRAEQCRDLIERQGAKIPWPPLMWPPRPLTLHEAMRSVLEQQGNEWTRIDFLAREIARQALYRRRDGLPASARDVSARVCAYPELFVRNEYVIRLLDPTAPPPRRRCPGR